MPMLHVLAYRLLHVLTACPRRMPMLHAPAMSVMHVHAAYPDCLYILHVPVASPCQSAWTCSLICSMTRNIDMQHDMHHGHFTMTYVHQFSTANIFSMDTFLETGCGHGHLATLRGGRLWIYTSGHVQKIAAFLSSKDKRGLIIIVTVNMYIYVYMYGINRPLSQKGRIKTNIYVGIIS